MLEQFYDRVGRLVQSVPTGFTLGFCGAGMTPEQTTRICRCWHCRGMMRVSTRALSVFCPHCQKRLSLESLRIVGSHPGRSLMTCGDVVVTSGAALQLDLYGHRVQIEGRVRGSVHADESVEVAPTGRVVGDILAPRIIIREGAVIEGRCHVTRPAIDNGDPSGGKAPSAAEPVEPATEPELPGSGEWVDVRPLPPSP